LSFIGVPEAPAQYFGGVTVLGVNKEYNSGLVERVQILWDGKSEPEKIHVIWSAPGIRPFGVFGGVIGGVKLGASARESLAEAFRYAVEQTPAVQHSGTVTLQGTSFVDNQRRAERRGSHGSSIYGHVQSRPSAGRHLFDRSVRTGWPDR